MFAPADRDLARYVAGYGVGLSPQLSALSAALSDLAAVSDDVTEAIQRHDRIALEAANARAEELLADIGRINASLTEDDRHLVAETDIATLCQALAVGARRNALLLEQAWAVDAALMRLVVGAGKDGVYNASQGPAYVDTQA
jgi:hypothetical protein